MSSGIFNFNTNRINNDLTVRILRQQIDENLQEAKNLDEKITSQIELQKTNLNQITGLERKIAQIDAITDSFLKNAGKVITGIALATIGFIGFLLYKHLHHERSKLCL